MAVAAVGLTLLSTVGFAVTTADAATAGEGHAVVAWVNDLRTSRGLRPLEPDPQLEQKAQEWSAHLARIGYLEHSKLSDGVGSTWVALAENVAMADTLEGAHQALLASPLHLANIVDPDMNRIGVGVTAADGLVYVVEEFMQLSPFTAMDRSGRRRRLCGPVPVDAGQQRGSGGRNGRQVGSVVTSRSEGRWARPWLTPMKSTPCPPPGRVRSMHPPM